MKSSTVRRITKIVASGIVGLGTTKIVSQIIANNTDEPENTFEKVQIGLASTVVGTMAVERTKTYTNDKIDLFFDRWTNAAQTEEKTEEETPDQK